MRSITLTAGITLAILIGFFAALTELAGCGTRLDWLAERLA